MEGEESKGDIFETDFEIPPMSDESGSEAVAIDSDTDIEPDVAVEEDSDLVAEEETGSQVVVLEDESDEGAGPGARRGRRPWSTKETWTSRTRNTRNSAAAALKGVNRAGWRTKTKSRSQRAAGPRRCPGALCPRLSCSPPSSSSCSAGSWGSNGRYMMGYSQPKKPAAPLVRGIAKTFDMDLKDQ